MKNILLTLTLAAAVLPATAQNATPDFGKGFSGKVVETTNAAGYTYVLVDAGAKKVWAATTEFEVKPGDTVNVSPGNDMPGFHSRALNKDFDSIIFTGSIVVDNGQAAAKSSAPALPAGHPPIGGASAGLPPNHPPINAASSAKPAPAKVEVADVKTAAGGKTVQQIIDDRQKLSGETVVVRGKVVKYNGGILGKNWLHIQDASGSAEKGNNDLTVTTATDCKVGDTVLVTGKVTINKDFGAGYKYAVILDDAQVVVE